ncbi:hypothetical protein RJT34_03338 [Clitoria ternatea]|uniref:Uncharacterized protein n=1 Tax=Clitoria ternatea TaxID=43366 RepID=A0AAN9PZR0_CLITE
MAEALLEVVLQNLNSLIQKELLASFWSIDREVKKLSSNLTAIMAVLKDAEEQQITNRAIRDWLRKLTDSAYLLDDILDGCSIQSTRLGFDGENSQFANKVSTKFLSVFNPRSVLFRYNIHKRIKEVKERLDEIADERNKFHFGERVVGKRLEVAEWRQTFSIVTQPQVYGRDADKEKIVEFLVKHASNFTDLSTYPIVGLGGVGKTTLAQLVFNDERVSKHFDLKIWVCVSEDFSIRSIMQSIIESLLGQNPNLLDLDPMVKQVQELLQSKTFLLVVDDVWCENQETWEKLKYVLACGSKGSSIVVTSRLTRVASIMGTLPAHHLSSLSEDESWLLFKKHAFGPDREETANLVRLGKDIVRKCGGLPLAVKTIGSLMRFKFEEKEWLFVKDSKFWDLPQAESGVLPALRLSYFHLSITLRRCFAFCAVYPKDTIIEKEDLILLWMANGLIAPKGALEVEDVGNEVWNELYCKSFFQDVVTDELGNVKYFKMHDLVHDLALSIMGEECLDLDDTRLTNMPRSIHYIIWSNSNGVLDVSALKKSESLRMLLQPYKASSSISCEFSAFHSLRALRLENGNLSSLGNLVHLRYLDLSFTDIKLLPKSIYCLLKLETLKLKSCSSLCGLPKKLARLQSLRHLMITACHSLSHMPPNMGKLTSLKTLSTFIVGSGKGQGLAELHLLKLGGDLHIKGLQNVGSGLDAKEANLIGKTDLNSLYLSWHCKGGIESLSEEVLENLQPHSNIKSLKIQNYDGVHLPAWMKNISGLNSLVVLKLDSCKNCTQLPPLGKLPSLEILDLNAIKNVHYVDDSSYDHLSETAFQSLKTLSLHRLPKLEMLLRDQGAQMFPLLSQLTIFDAHMLSLPFLPSVEVLRIDRCNKEVLKSISNFHCLTFLQLCYNTDLVSLDQGMIGNFYHLKTLHISEFTKLEALPIELSKLNALEELEIKYCHELVCFPEQVLEGLCHLKTLKVSYCEKFHSLSEGIQHLTSLEQLEIRGCPELLALPNGINNLTHLRALTITDRSRHSVPFYAEILIGPRPYCLVLEGIELVPFLHSLTIEDFDNITSLPDCVGKLVSLQRLCIRSCQHLISLPASIQTLTNLEEIEISCCAELVKQCTKGTGREWHKIAHVRQIKIYP